MGEWLLAQNSNMLSDLQWPVSNLYHPWFLCASARRPKISTRSKSSMRCKRRMHRLWDLSLLRFTLSWPNPKSAMVHTYSKPSCRADPGARSSELSNLCNYRLGMLARRLSATTFTSTRYHIKLYAGRPVGLIFWRWHRYKLCIFLRWSVCRRGFGQYQQCSITFNDECWWRKEI